MQENQASITALITAYTRAYHAAQASPRIFDDFIAGQLFTPEEQITFRRNIVGLLSFVDPQSAAANPDEESALRRVMQTYNGSITLSRSRYTEDCIEQSLENGLEQYVILGAGMDTYACRHPELASRLQIFEVDHPATQAVKQDKLKLLGGGIPSNLRLVPVDFAAGDMEKALVQAGFNPAIPAFFSWLGVTYYLTQDAINTSLAKLSELAAPGSSLVFDYMHPDAFDPKKAAKRMQLMQKITLQVGEPMITALLPEQLTEKLQKFGFLLVENLTPVDIENRYFANRMDDYHAFEHVHFARALKSN
jgi:methyltransferase (TIGR00027 family)